MNETDEFAAIAREIAEDEMKRALLGEQIQLLLSILHDVHHLDPALVYGEICNLQQAADLLDNLLGCMETTEPLKAVS